MRREYKLNKYIYVQTRPEIIIIYNLLSKVIFGLSKEKYELLTKTDLSELEVGSPVLFSAMKKLQIIIPKELNELQIIQMLNRQHIFDTKSYRLTINPTLECNFKCWYCYENHPAGYMQPGVMRSVVRHINRKISEENLKYLHLDWFGGEPLLYFDEVMYPLSKSIKKITTKTGTLLTGSITTNGYLIDEKHFDLFRKIELNNFQITLDGNQPMHDKIRSQGNKGSFSQILRNINRLSEYEENSILVRINYTEKTLREIHQIIPFFSPKAKSRIKIHFQQVWQDSFKKNISADAAKKEFIRQGFHVQQHGLNTKWSVCYADFLNQAIINYDGKVFKCTARDFATTQPDGVLLSNGDIDWDTVLLSKRLGTGTFENPYCLRCDFLPVCMGPCSQKMIEFTSEEDFKKICLKDGVISTIEEKMNDYYNKFCQQN